MSIWKPSRSPELYLATWHQAIRSPEKTCFLAFAGDSKEAFLIQRKFNAFRACLRAHPQHPTAQALAKYDVRLSFESGVFGDVLITVNKRPKLGEIFLQEHLKTT